MRILFLTLFLNLYLSLGSDIGRDPKQLSLFSIVQFPNDDCTSSTDSSTTGTCYSSSECTSRSGTASGSCAAGFGVCCVISTSTCGATLSTNNTYIRNPGYPSSITPTSTGSTCTTTISKLSSDICQLRLDFQTMTGYTATTAGVCTDKFEATGQTGKNPPTICGTNTGYHMYLEFGGSATDTIELKTTYGDLTSKQWNILARQIACTATWKAPTDCVQYFTAVSGSVKNYNFGNQIIQGQNYDNCVRTGKGYCRIQWQSNSATTPNSFQLDAIAGTEATTALNACPLSYVEIPSGSQNGQTPLNPGLSPLGFQSVWCGDELGISGQSVGSSIVSSQRPFTLGFYTASAALTTAATTVANGFHLDYTQLPC